MGAGEKSAVMRAAPFFENARGKFSPGISTRDLRIGRSQTMMVFCPLRAAIRLLSRENTGLEIAVATVTGVARGRAGQSITVRSLDPVASIVPSGEKATQRSSSPWPFNVARI